jgi:hypothetical protein
MLITGSGAFSAVLVSALGMLIIAMITAAPAAAIVSAAIFPLLIRGCFIAFSVRRLNRQGVVNESFIR